MALYGAEAWIMRSLEQRHVNVDEVIEKFGWSATNG